ncbi:MAG: S9 family peptidase [Candidatus Eremiobacteraeota bacterium]|nr:S9 family peptidase [Candidatus Eremiobacteraeota bacterium]MBC5828204.1 S9 family peptidase [Candidatus Eremiobacteraeota bacterium]
MTAIGMRPALAAATALWSAAAALSDASSAKAGLQNPSIVKVLEQQAAVHTYPGVAISPDGRRVAWVESIPFGNAGASRMGLFVAQVRSAGASVRRIRAAQDGKEHGEQGVSWSPDSKHIAFVATPGSSVQAQIYVADSRSGAARRLTAIKGDVSDARWSPDGKSIAFLFIEDAPKTPGPLAPTARDAGVVESKVYEQRIAVIDVATAQLRRVSPAGLYVYEYDWSPDGRNFAASAAAGSGDNNWWIASLYSFSVSSGQARTILKPPLQIADPRWSPDGRSIAYIGGIMSDEGSTGGDIFTVPAEGGQPKDITPGMQASATWLAWDPAASQRIIFSQNANGLFAFATVDAATGSIATKWSRPEVMTAQDGPGLSVARNGDDFAAVRSSFERPPEVWAGRIASWSQMTHGNDVLRPQWGEARSLQWSSDALRVQGWLLYPLGFDPAKRYPMVVVVHGGPAAANVAGWPGNFNGLLASQGYFVFLPNPRGSFGQGESFTQANVKDFGYGDFRDIMAGVNAVTARVPVDPARVGIFGWSYGGYMTMWAVTQTDRFRAAVAGAGLANWQSYYGENGIDQWMIPYFGASVYDDPAVYARSSPMTFIKNVKTPTLMLQGERDAEVPAPQSYEFWHALKTLGVPTELVIYPDEGHRIAKPEHVRDRAQRIVGWFDRYLK